LRAVPKPLLVAWKDVHFRHSTCVQSRGYWLPLRLKSFARKRRIWDARRASLYEGGVGFTLHASNARSLVRFRVALTPRFGVTARSDPTDFAISPCSKSRHRGQNARCERAIGNRTRQEGPSWQQSRLPLQKEEPKRQRWERLGHQGPPSDARRAPWRTCWVHSRTSTSSQNFTDRQPRSMPVCCLYQIINTATIRLM
jgi:hypothetical protein